MHQVVCFICLLYVVLELQHDLRDNMSQGPGMFAVYAALATRVAHWLPSRSVPGLESTRTGSEREPLIFPHGAIAAVVDNDQSSSQERRP